MPTWRFLHLAETSTLPLDVIAEQFGWCISRCEELLARAEEIAAIREERGHKVRRISMVGGNVSADSAKTPKHFWLKMPRQVGLDLACAHEQKVVALVQSKRQLVQHAFRGYLQNMWRTTRMPVFRDPSEPEDAIHYVQFLEEIGFPKSSLQFVHFNPTQRSSFRNQWRLALHLDWRYADKIVFRKPPFRQTRASDQWLAIVPLFAGAKSKGESGLLKGFHFLMVMAAIAFGYDGSSVTTSVLDLA